MKKLSLLPAVLAAVGLMIVLNGNVSAHPGIEGVFECHEEEGDDVGRAVLLENEDDGDEAAPHA